MKELDLRDTGLREVARQTTNISGCFAREKDHTNSKQANKKEIDCQVYSYWQRSGLGHIGR